tara:strand:+ start:13975 stop:14286 length:312 start_codon:yes stop_codon:yes gene_type:complete
MRPTQLVTALLMRQTNNNNGDRIMTTTLRIAQDDIRTTRESSVASKRPAKPVVGNHFYGLPPRLAVGWVHGVHGVLIEVVDGGFVLDNGEGDQYTVPQIYKLR